MLFNSYIFILVFLPIVLSLYFILNRFSKVRWAKGTLILASLAFYGFNNISYVVLITISICVNYGIYRCITKKKAAKAYMIAGILANAGLLFYFKYYDFFIENLNVLLKDDFNLKHLILPLGISFYTFQQIGFLIDAYRGQTGHVKFVDYCVFVTFFPQLVAGPIVSHDEIICQFQDESKQKVDWNNISAGLYGLTMGLGKKVLIADTFGNAVNAGFLAIDTLNTLEVVFIMIAYTFQIYFDFSGYCDMASGIAKMFNITLPVNFDSPYKSTNILEFWKRWHMTLTRFLRNYVYIPLGGNRGGGIRTGINTMIVYLVSGLWHGANWTFVLWGGVHGLACVLTKCFYDKIEKGHKAFNWVCTFGFVNIMWLVFRAESLAQVKLLGSKLLHFDLGVIRPELLLKFKLPELDWLFSLFHLNQISYYTYFFVLIFFAGALFTVLNLKNIQEKMREFSISIGKCVSTVLVLWLCILSFQSVSTFLYFNF